MLHGVSWDFLGLHRSTPSHCGGQGFKSPRLHQANSTKDSCTRASLLRCDLGGGERGSAIYYPAIYCPATISNGETQVTGSCTLLHFGQVRTWVPVRRLPSPERHSETVICQELTQERPGLQ
jgi:hypothetical protein